IGAVDTPQNLRFQLQGAERIFIEVEGPQADVISKLQSTPGVMNVEQIEKTDGRNRFRIESELRKDIRSELARTIVQSGWGLLELQSDTMSLEDIFLKLTTAEDGNS